MTGFSKIRNFYCVFKFLLKVGSFEFVGFVFFNVTRNNNKKAIKFGSNFEIMNILFYP